MISTARDANATKQKAPSDGSYWLNGVKYKTRAGAPLPEGAEFEPAKPADAKPAFQPWTDEPETADAKPKRGKKGGAGPSQTTQAAGPTETADATEDA